MAELAEFNLLAELPFEGRLLIEASAGTGKTYALAALTTRYIAESERTIDQILVVTFGRLAAKELRERIRDRLSATVSALKGDPTVAFEDELARHLGTTERELHVRRLERAIIDFDTATITTIHSFAQQIRSLLGTAGEFDLEAVLLDDTEEIAEEVASDLLAADALRGSESLAVRYGIGPYWRKELVKLAKIALNNPAISILPDPTDDDLAQSSLELQEALAKGRMLGEVLDEVRRRRRSRRRLSYDDILTQLRDALSANPRAVDLLRRRYPIALVDEFQDTDDIQWEIFERLFGAKGSGTRLVLVGDPKQAIYGFRGANVYTYLEAAELLGVEQRRLTVNYRSDGALLAGLEQLFGDATFGHSGIGFQPVVAAGGHSSQRIVSRSEAPLPALVVRTALGVELDRGKRGLIATGAAREAIARDLAATIHNLLDDAFLPPGEKEKVRRVQPSDIAVLVARNAEAVAMQKALRDRGIPAVIRQGLSVLESEAQQQWQFLLLALERPSDPDLARRVALGWFFDIGAEVIAIGSDENLRNIQETLLRWSETLKRSGVVDFCATVFSESGVIEHVLRSRDGDRKLTDLNQIAGLLHRTELPTHPSATGLLRVLDHLRELESEDLDEDLLAQQIESDVKAVQIMTVHKSKGLEFPIVCVPTMWHAIKRNEYYQDPTTNRRVLAIDLPKSWPGMKDRQRFAQKDAQGEDLRLLYVALTRAQHQTIVWWTRVHENQNSALARMLFATGDERRDIESDGIPPITIPEDSATPTWLAKRLGDGNFDRSVTVIDAGSDAPQAPRWNDPETNAPVVGLEVALLTRELEPTYHRWSFSAMVPNEGFEFDTAGGHYDPSDESLGDSGASDEGLSQPIDTVAMNDGPRATDLPLGEIPGGTEFGTLVHRVLQKIDFADLELEESLITAIKNEMRWSAIAIDPVTLARGLRLVIETPLGPVFDDLSLRDISRKDRLDELSFELHLGAAGNHRNIREIGYTLARHLDAADPLRMWALDVSEGLFDDALDGHLTGSIDLVARIHGAGRTDQPSRFFLADYKTNTLGARGELPVSSDYAADHLFAAMVDHHYPLQATLYAVALHRYLRWRVRDYDPALHFGGIAYLFVRGMTGSNTPRLDGCPNGVFSWKFSPALLMELSDLLDGKMVLN